MPYQIQLDHLPLGYAATAARPGEKVWVCSRRFVSSEDGAEFLTLIEGFPSDVVGKLSQAPGISCSTIDHMLVVIRRDKTATVYVNELKMTVEMQSKRDLKAGEAVFVDDIADIRGLRIDGVEIPPDSGVAFVFSKGWRKGYFFDFEPLHGTAREYDFEKQSAQYLAYLFFQHMFGLSDEDWGTLFQQGWFPFISLKEETVKQILACVRNAWSVDELHLDAIVNEVESLLEPKLEGWRKNTVFKDHIRLIERAIERYREGDYESPCAILYPRIEGIMHSHQKLADGRGTRKQTRLVRSVMDAGKKGRHTYSLLLPEKFQHYLQDVYFADFDPDDPQGLSRHTVAHGVAPEEEFSRKGATIGFLLLAQLSYYLGGEAVHEAQ